MLEAGSPGKLMSSGICMPLPEEEEKKIKKKKNTSWNQVKGEHRGKGVYG